MQSKANNSGSRDTSRVVTSQRSDMQAAVCLLCNKYEGFYPYLCFVLLNEIRLRRNQHMKKLIKFFNKNMQKSAYKKAIQIF